MRKRIEAWAVSGQDSGVWDSIPPDDDSGGSENDNQPEHFLCLRR